MASVRKIEPTPQKKTYKKPVLTKYGKLKDLTTGGTGNAQEPGQGKKPRQ
jgi:hypothetical protein